MSTDPNAPSPAAMFKGEGEWWQVVLSRVGFFVLIPLFVAGLLSSLHIVF